ncbi:TetR family transcriptional regulator [Actinomycetota bacterium]|nr:TetR family transcriptional regulator [Actinomycetota bacterium]
MRADAARNRQAVLDAARDLFAVHGLEVSMETIAQTAGVGVGTIYRHFPDRSALVQAMIRDRIAHVSALASTAEQDLWGPDPAAAWDAFFTGFIASGLPLLLPVLLAHVHEANVFAPEIVAARNALIRRADVLFHRAQELGLMHPDLALPEVALMLGAVARVQPGLPLEVHRALLARRLVLVRAAFQPGGPPLPGVPVTVDQLLATLDT